jgi:hypothetical protein
MKSLIFGSILFGLVLAAPSLGNFEPSLPVAWEKGECASPDGSCTVTISDASEITYHCANNSDCYGKWSGAFQSRLDKMFLPQTLNSIFPRQIPVSFQANVSPVVIDQKVCSCESKGGQAHGSISCGDGCSSFCGSSYGYLACQANILYPRITVSLTQKTGKEIAEELSHLMKKKIQFAPYPRYANERYDIELKDDEGWGTLTALHRRGKVTIGGVTFDKLVQLAKQIHNGKTIS